ncbi:hypothetical protein ACLOJK_030072 [Asimina triloba]
MATSFSLIQRLLLLSLLATGLASSSHQDQFTFNGFKDANVTLEGIALIHPSSGLLQLTNTSHQRQGHVFHPSPFNFRNPSSDGGGLLSFSTSFVFAIVSQFPGASGNGLFFTISPSIGFPESLPSQYFGVFNSGNNGNSSNHVFGVEIDTLLNPEYGDIDNNHVGIDVNGLRSIQSATASYYDNQAGKNKSLSLVSGEPIQIWIDYDGAEKQINVTVCPFKKDKPNHPLLSFHQDLSSLIFDTMYVAISASTGGLSGSHYVLGWTFAVGNASQPLDPSRLPPVPRKRRSSDNHGWKIGWSIAAAAVVLTAVYVARRVTRRRENEYEELHEDWEQEYGPHRFSYKDLSIATKGFSDEELLGVGGFGSVYRGLLPKSNIQVAVKRVSHDSKQGMKEFVAEVVSIGRLRHRNLVQLLGYCRRRGELLLVYDYMENGSVDKFLFGREKPALSWPQRFRIVKGVASGLLYLHEEWEKLVLHRDIKASNVLLDGEMNGRLGDFGLARLYDHGTCPHTTHVVGTLGYLAPEITRTGKATTCTDVYSFGAFLLEVACGRRPIEWQASSSTEEMDLVDWVFLCLKKGRIGEARDRLLGGDYAAEELELVLKLGLLCSHPMPEVRPSMRQVVQFLNGDASLPELSLEGLERAMILARTWRAALSSRSVEAWVLSGGR